MHFLSIPLTCALDTRQWTGYHINSIPLPGAEHASHFYTKLAVGLSLCVNRTAARSSGLHYFPLIISIFTFISLVISKIPILFSM